MVEYARELLEKAVKKSKSIPEVYRLFGLGKSNRWRERKALCDQIEKAGIDISGLVQKERRLAYSDEELAKVAASSVSVMEVLRKLGYKKLAGGTHSHIKKRIDKAGIDTSHFLGERSRLGQSPGNRLSANQILVLRTEGTRQKSYLLRRSLLEEGREEKCEGCGIGPEWQGKPLSLQINHINGNFLDDRKENLRFLCSNCHSQTPTFSRRNRAGMEKLVDSSGLGPEA